MPSPTHFDDAPWIMRSLLLIPALQLIDVVATLRNLGRWRRHPGSRPIRGRLWREYILLPLIPNLLTALTLVPMLSKMRDFLMVFTPDFSWVARINGSFAIVWSFLRTLLFLTTLRDWRSGMRP